MSTIHPTELLAKVPMFRDLGKDDLARLAEGAHVEHFARGADIVEMGDPGHALFVVIEGEVQVLYPARSTDFELARLGPGECFGEMALLNEMPRSATVRAVNKVLTLTLSKDEFRAKLLAMPSVALALLSSLSTRIRNADEQISGLSDKAMKDPLTGLLNRRAFNDRINEETDRTRRYGEAFSLILIDLDKFKSINDSFGHDTGDAILAWVGRLLIEHTRAADSAYRIGGEEFAILCPSSSGEVTRKAACRLIGVLAGARPPVSFDLTVTMSAGYATAPTDGRRPDELFQVADQALLRAKRQGRNRVCDPAPA